MVFIKQIDGAFKEIKKRLKKLIQICCTPRIKDMAVIPTDLMLKKTTPNTV